MKTLTQNKAMYTSTGSGLQYWSPDSHLIIEILNVNKTQSVLVNWWNDIISVCIFDLIATPGRGYSQPIGIPHPLRGPPPTNSPQGGVGSPQTMYQSPQQQQNRYGTVNNVISPKKCSFQHTLWFFDTNCCLSSSVYSWYVYDVHNHMILANFYYYLILTIA